MESKFENVVSSKLENLKEDTLSQQAQQPVQQAQQPAQQGQQPQQQQAPQQEQPVQQQQQTDPLQVLADALDTISDGDSSKVASIFDQAVQKSQRFKSIYNEIQQGSQQDVDNVGSAPQNQPAPQQQQV